MNPSGPLSGPGPPRGSRFLVLGLTAALLITLASRVHYAFFFLPRHHGSWRESLRQIVDLDGWSEYVRGRPGLAFHVALLVAVLVAGGGAVAAWRSKGG